MLKTIPGVSQLWKIAKEYPYRKEDFNTTFRSSEHFKESYANKNLSFIETRYEMLSMGRSKGIEPLISESQPEVLPLN